MSMGETAYRAGWEARHDGWHRHQNPYSGCGGLYDAWADGWAEADERLCDVDTMEDYGE